MFWDRIICLEFLIVLPLFPRCWDCTHKHFQIVYTAYLSSSWVLDIVPRPSSLPPKLHAPQQCTSALHHPPSFFLAWLIFQPKCNPPAEPFLVPPLSPGLPCVSLLSSSFLNLFSVITHAKLHQTSIYKLMLPLKDTNSDLSAPLPLISSTCI